MDLLLPFTSHPRNYCYYRRRCHQEQFWQVKHLFMTRLHLPPHVISPPHLITCWLLTLFTTSIFSISLLDIGSLLLQFAHRHY